MSQTNSELQPAEQQVVAGPRRRESLTEFLPSVKLQLALLLLLAILYTLYFARELLLPIVLASVFNLLLSPLVNWLHRWHVPRTLSAMLVVWAFMAAVVGAAVALSAPASDWLERLPQFLERAETKTSTLKQGLEQVAEASETIEELASGVTSSTPDDDIYRQQVEVKVQEGDDWRTALFSGTSALMAYFLAMMALLFFLLAAGNSTLRKIANLWDTSASRHKALEVAGAIQQEISRYLLSITFINITLGVVVSLAMWALGMPNPWLWGSMLTLLNFMPYIGSVLAALVVGVVAFLTFDGLAQIILPPLVLMFCTTMEGMVITPMLLGIRLSMNPVVILLFILFWGWLWGIAGVLLAVPLLAIAKVCCDKIQGPLAPWGRLISS